MAPVPWTCSLELDESAHRRECGRKMGERDMSMALVFPGQGSQAVGMGKALASDFAMARGVFEEIDAALGQKLSRLMFEGPESELTLTANAQPALMAVSLAALRVLESNPGR
jgi:[acyl-carrier-protein] S-malonyltransferase